MTDAEHPSPATPADHDRWSGFLRDNAGWIAAGAAAVALAGSALFNRSRTRQAEVAAPPAGQFVEVDGMRLHYVDRGAGPVVVMLHGNGMDWHDFEVSGVLDLAVAAGYRVLAFDRPGFGYSDRPRSRIWTPSAQADVIAQAVAALGITCPTVLGHSWGTLVALAYALDRPAEVAGLVLVSGYYFPTARPDVVMFSPPAIPVLGDMLAHTLSPLAGRALAPATVKAMFAPAAVPDSFARFPLELALRPSQVRATAADTAEMVPAAALLAPRYRELTLPIAVLAGEGDLITHIGRHAEAFVAAVPSSELRRVPGQGHMLHYAVPEEVIDAIDTVSA